MPARIAPCGLGIETSTSVARVAGSSAGLIAAIRPVKTRPSSASTVAVARCPTCSRDAWSSGTCSRSRIGSSRSSVTTVDAGVTYSPAATGRFVTKPSNGARIVVSASALRASASRERASAMAASAVATDCRVVSASLAACSCSVRETSPVLTSDS
ncbi:hypothetical protein D3C83_21890 [compost metagenome]